VIGEDNQIAIGICDEARGELPALERPEPHPSALRWSGLVGAADTATKPSS
jgi:hypothetical protein